MSYIHELPGWPELSWDMDALAAPLAAVRHAQGKHLGRMQALGFDLRAEANLAALTEEIVRSSAIEGDQLAAAEVRSSVARKLGLDAAGLPLPGREVEGVVEMMLDATRDFDAPLTAERLFGWHAALFPTGRSGMSRITVGAWRTDATGPMQVVSGPIGKERVHFGAPDADAPRWRDGSVPGLVHAVVRDGSRAQGGRGALLVRHDPPLRRWQRPHRPRDRRHGAGPRGRHEGTLLQHVVAASRRSARSTTGNWRPRSAAASTSRRGWRGSCVASTGRSWTPRRRSAA